MNKFTTIILTLAVALIAASTAAAHTTHWYIPRHDAKCRTNYRREIVRVDKTRRVRRHGRMVTLKVRKHGHVVKVRQVRCVHRTAKKQTTVAQAPVIGYKANVDPSFTQSPTNPLAVTYSYSADATETIDGTTIDLGAEGQLPAGVLNFYSATTPGGSVGLVCSMNVGGATLGGSCPVTVAATGSYAVTTEYIPNSAGAVTETDTETIVPAATTTTLPSQTSGPDTTYSPAIVGAGGSPVAFGTGDVSFAIVDTTTGQAIGTLASQVSASEDQVGFEVELQDFSGLNEPAICDAQFSCVGPVTPSDSFTVQAVYSPSFGSAWSGSASTPETLQVSP